MQTRGFLIALLTFTQLTGCAGYHVASGASWLATDRTIPDWTASLATGYDCRTGHVVSAKYFCEKPVVYNQSGL